MIFFMAFISFVFVLFFYCFCFVFCFKMGQESKLGSFECGFTSLGALHSSFSVHFFIILLMFVIFDLEVVAFLGVVVSDFFGVFSVFALFFFILLGFYMEWFYGKLVWLV